MGRFGFTEDPPRCKSSRRCQSVSMMEEGLRAAQLFFWLAACLKDAHGHFVICHGVVSATSNCIQLNTMMRSLESRVVVDVVSFPPMEAS